MVGVTRLRALSLLPSRRHAHKLVVKALRAVQSEAQNLLFWINRLRGPRCASTTTRDQLFNTPLNSTVSPTQQSAYIPDGA